MKKKKTLLTLFAILVCFTALIVLLQYRLIMVVYFFGDIKKEQGSWIIRFLA